MLISREEELLMSRLKYIKNISSNEISIMRILKAIKRRVIDIPHKISWSLPFEFQRNNLSKLKSLKDSHKGKRCFIIANGPSINSMDLSVLKNELTIGMNRIYLHEKK